jgi:LmbE family N-acetylglucosaminyl deacetylase
MISVNLLSADHGLRRILCIGAHADDIEIGCGGTLLQILDAHPGLSVCWVVLSSDEKRKQEALDSANGFLAKAKDNEILIRDFQDGFFPYIAGPIKRFFETLKAFSPDLIFTHYGKDAHQDHRLASRLTWNTFRDHLILEYEIPKYDGDLGQPNVFVSLDRDICAQKVARVLKVFGSQRDKHWFTEDLLMSLMRIRGMETRSRTGLAEAFHVRKLALR